MSDGNTHNNFNVPVVVVGRDQRMKGNRHLSTSSRPWNGSPRMIRHGLNDLV